MRNHNISKSNVVLCVICQPNMDSHRMREQRGHCISKQCGSNCPVKYKICTCLANVSVPSTTYEIANVHLAAVDSQQLTPLKPKGTHPAVKEMMNNIVRNNPLLKPSRIAMAVRQKMRDSGINIEVNQNTLKNLASKKRQMVAISVKELLDPLEQDMVDCTGISNQEDTKPFIFRVAQDSDGEYDIGIGNDSDPFRLYISAPKIVLSMLFDEMNRVNGGGVVLHLDSTYKTNLLGYHLIPCGFSDRSSNFVPLFYLIASHQKEEVVGILTLGF